MAIIAALVVAALQGTAQQPMTLTGRTAFDTTIAPSATHQYAVLLDAGESASIVFRQEGVDLVIEVYDPNRKLLTTVDSPNGRTGDEPVEVIARTQGAYLLRVRPYGPEEPAGRYHVSVPALRNAQATRDMLAARASARDTASAWLSRLTALTGNARAYPVAFDAKFDSVARRTRVIGLGEATHGSREFGDTRLRLTKRAIEQAGYRIVAIEHSAVRLAQLNEYVAGRGARTSADQLVDAAFGWIGRRSLRELVSWLRGWNSRHPNDAVSLVGVDAQNVLPALLNVRVFLQSAYGNRVAATWASIERELATADSQTYVFGDSRVDSVVRQRLFELVAAVKLDEPALRRLQGDSSYDRALTALTILAQFADFNNPGSAAVGHGRDWYMAANLLRAQSQRRNAKAVFWAHNSHIAHPEPADRSALNGPAGSVLRATLGCGYQAIALTFGDGAFLAQRPNDPQDRLAVDSLPPNVDESVERVMSRVASTMSLSMWGCTNAAVSVPSWLRRPQQMHSLGGLWLPGSNAAEANRPTQLLRDYDGLIYIPRVNAEEAPSDLPSIPPRNRRAP